MLALLYLIGVLVLSLVFTTVSLYFIAKAFSATKLTWWRVVALVLWVSVVSTTLQVVVAVYGGLESLLSAVFWFVVFCVANVGVYRSLLGLAWPRASGAWLTHMLVNVVFGFALTFPLRLYVAEAYRGPSNAMAPTLLGDHVKLTCAHCRAPAVASAMDHGDRRQFQLGFVQPAICTQCKQISNTDVSANAKTISGDRFMVDKLLTPQRWDLIVYQARQADGLLYVHRLVGLPG